MPPFQPFDFTCYDLPNTVGTMNHGEVHCKKFVEVCASGCFQLEPSANVPCPATAVLLDVFSLSLWRLFSKVSLSSCRWLAGGTYFGPFRPAFLPAPSLRESPTAPFPARSSTLGGEVSKISYEANARHSHSNLLGRISAVILLLFFRFCCIYYKPLTETLMSLCYYHFSSDFFYGCKFLSYIFLMLHNS